MEADNDGESSDSSEDLDSYEELQKNLQEVKDVLRAARHLPLLMRKWGRKLLILEAQLAERLLVVPVFQPFNFRSFDHVPHFRFSAAHLILMARNLLPPDVSSRGCTTSGLQALCIFLRKLSYPCRWRDIRAEFGGPSASWLSTIFHATLDILHAHAVRNLYHWSPGLSDEIAGLVQFSNRSLGLNAWAAIDGTSMHICRSHVGQRAFYSGYEGNHVLRLLAVCKMNGLFERVFGPSAGSASDVALYNDFGVEDHLDALHDAVEEEQGFRPLILGDSIFQTTMNMITPFKRPKKPKKVNGVRPPHLHLTQQQTHFNYYHSRNRIGGEWGFQRLLANFAALDFSKAHRIFQTSPDTLMLVGMLMTNFVVVARGAQHEGYYGTQCPSFESYLQQVQGNEQL